jgi:hypothetical protein
MVASLLENYHLNTARLMQDIAVIIVVLL